MVSTILELIFVSAKIFSEERKRYYENKAQNLLRRIAAVEDSQFYKKDMEAKGKAERELMIQTEELKKEFIKEATK